MRGFRGGRWVLAAVLLAGALAAGKGEVLRVPGQRVVLAVAGVGESSSSRVAREMPAASDASFLRVVYVVDGDTIKVMLDGVTTTVRLLGADTPEVVDPRKSVQCFGPEASAETKRLIAAGADEVRLETDPTQSLRDQYGRLLAYVYLPDGTLLDEQLIATGYAREYTFKGSAYRFQSQFRAAQANARAAKLGLWSPQTCNGGR